MAAEHSLPCITHTGSTSTANAVKRQQPSSPTFSSDPIFSSEDDEPSCENYLWERPKKRVRGPWYCHRPYSIGGSHVPIQNSVKTERKWKRNFDSGIFMGSDNSSADECSDSTEPSHMMNSPRAPCVSFIVPSEDDLVERSIQRILEDGNETLDLSSRGLQSLPSEAIKQLSSFARVPTVTDGIFTALEPALKIFLTSNQLTTLPYELFNLDRLEVLSLRGNLINDLPPAVGNLLSLKELNLSQNALYYLPFEILSLFSEKGSLESLSLHPNFFYEPEFRHNDNTSSQIIYLDRYKFNSIDSKLDTTLQPTGVSKKHNKNPWKTEFRKSTEVRYFDINGMLLKGPTFPSPGLQSISYSLPVAKECYYPEPPLPRGNVLSRVPSLLETALSACAKTPQLSSLSLYLPDESPAYLRDLIKLAVDTKNKGGTLCTICGRKFIIARTEWIEWWDISKPKNSDIELADDFIFNDRDMLERMVPLMRKGCSWLCVPARCNSGN